MYTAASQTRGLDSSLSQSCADKVLKGAGRLENRDKPIRGALLYYIILYYYSLLFSLEMKRFYVTIENAMWPTLFVICQITLPNSKSIYSSCVVITASFLKYYILSNKQKNWRVEFIHQKKSQFKKIVRHRLSRKFKPRFILKFLSIHTLQYWKGHDTRLDQLLSKNH